MASEQKLTLLGHLTEMRKRLTRSVLAVVIGIIIAFIFYKWIFYFLMKPAGNANFIFLKLTEGIGITMKVCLAAGVILAIPYITIQLVLFIRPALTAKETRYVYLILPWIAIMFIGGVAFGYYVLIPPAVNFLYQFGSDLATMQLTLDSYINLITRLLLAIGLVFEMPVVTTFLARIGIVKPQWMASKRRMAIIGAFVLAAVITPTFDPINQTLMAIPLIILYELSIWMARLVYRPKEGEKVELIRPAAGQIQVLMLMVTAAGGLFTGVSLLLAPDGSRLGWSTDMLAGTGLADFTWPGLLLVILAGIMPGAFAYYLFKRYNWAWAGSLVLEMLVLAGIILAAVLPGKVNPWLMGAAAWGLVMLAITLVPSVRKYYTGKPKQTGDAV